MHLNLLSFLSPSIPITIIIEGIVLWLWCRKKKKDFPAFLGLLTLANLLTQFLLIAALYLSPFRYWPTLLTMELLIVIIEAEILMKTSISRKNATKLSLLVNIVSFSLGLLLPI